ncbi:excinuclease ABC subunit C, partial [Candidatus Kaiserbacteria bacterium]|nr:excinuclease ABC subunit C [Candidatus Kaiserbacteria bacterium]
MKPSLSKIPSDPGVYLYRNTPGEIIYIGKAKNLRNRVRSYWSRSADLSPAKQEMVAEVAHIDYVAVGNETEALLLEAGLIKKHLPKYNISIRDDKSWTYIVITDEAFPRIITVHGLRKVKGEYFGPFTRAASAKTIVRLLHRILPLRTCKRDLSKLPNGLVCMQYHLGNCLGPCEKKINDSEYAALIEKARSILRADTKKLLKELETDMRKASDAEEYEQAAVYRNKLKALKSLSISQQIVHPLLADQDTIAIVGDNELTVITVMQARHGQLLDTLHFNVANELGLPRDEVLEQFMAQYYAQMTRRPRELAVPFRLSRSLERALQPMRILRPQRGRRKKILTMAEKNAWLYFTKITQRESVLPVLYDLKEALDLAELPLRIEAYDISNISGVYAVGAMVVAENGKLTPSQYRKFRIKTVTGPDDVHMMRETLERRQKHSEWPDPQLIVVDGGKPQLNTVYPILKTAWKS